VREWGDDGAPFLFWHTLGPAASGATIAVAAEPLVDAGFRVIAPDAPGFGRSPPADVDAYHADQLAKLLWQVADATDAPHPVVGGHSWGGTVGVIAAAQQPDRMAALVLFDSGHADFTDLPDADLTTTRDELILNAADNSEADSWDNLVELLRAEDLDQP
jgi:pimeloyl-ACP methyl ester carboxylesterase